MANREALPVGGESSEFLTCACCFARVTRDGYGTMGRRTPKSPPPKRYGRGGGVICKNDELTRERERAWRADMNQRERAWRFCYLESIGAKFSLVTTGERKHHPRRFCNNNDQLTRERASMNTGLSPRDLLVMDLAAFAQEVGGSSTSASSPNMPMICRATAASVENESDASEMRLRLSMLNVSDPLLPTNAHPYVCKLSKL